MPVINKMQISSDNDSAHCEVLVKRQIRNDKSYDTTRKYDLFLIGSTAVIQWEDGGLWTHGTIVGIGGITTTTIDPIQFEPQWQAT